MRLIQASNLYYVRLLTNQKSFIGILNTNKDKIKNIETGEIYLRSEADMSPIKYIFSYDTVMHGNFDLDSYRFKHVVLPYIKRRIKKIERHEKNKNEIESEIEKEIKF